MQSASAVTAQTSRDISASVQYAKGVGPRRAKLLERLGVRTMEDLFTLFPRRYEDRAHTRTISQMRIGDQGTVSGVVSAVRFQRFRRMSLVQVAIGDTTGVVHASWFNQPYMRDRFKVGDRLFLFGRFQLSRKKLVVYNPEYEFIIEGEESIHMDRIAPVYPLTEGLQQRVLRAVQWRFMEKHLEAVGEVLPAAMAAGTGMDRREAMGHIHFPRDMQLQQKARRRLALEELFFFQLALAKRQDRQKKAQRGFLHEVRGPKMQAFLTSLPFRPTKAQTRVINQIRHDMAGPHPMNRLLEGDVGCGKTVVAMAAAMIALDSGTQTAVMVPTEILAEQHHRNFSRLLEPLGVRVGLLSGGQKPARRRQIIALARAGELDILVGTHALIQEGVAFRRLGLAIVDEQHKFGVMQREKLRDKGNRPDVLVMTATPIPRTLALTLYGDLEDSVIDELPPGRQPVTTYWIAPRRIEKAYDFIRREVQKGRQAFVVYPLVEESQKISAKAVLAMARELTGKHFTSHRVGVVHGKMAGKDKDAIMQAFARRQLDILVCSSVVEVGIDIPNATCMLVEDAQRFGLAQLHQLRGRIGRGDLPSTFILVSDPAGAEGYERMKALKDSHDGFVIAEEDLRIRGPGEFFGVRQHGMPELRLASLVSDKDLLMQARQEAFRIVKQDPDLRWDGHAQLAGFLKQRFGDLEGQAG